MRYTFHGKYAMSVMLHIKMEMEHRTSCKHIFCPYTHPRPLVWGPKVKMFLMKIVMLHLPPGKL